MVSIDPAEKPLELEIRRTIYLLVKKHAGAHFRELARISGLASGSIKYHLNYLVHHKLITTKKDGKLVRYFPLQFNTSNKIVMSFLRQKSVRNILLYILEHESCNHEDICKAVQIAPSTISWHLKKLEHASIISSKREGRKTFYQLDGHKDEIISLLISHKESFVDRLVDRIVDAWEV